MNKFFTTVVKYISMIIMGYLTIKSFLYRIDMPLNGVSELSVYQKNIWPVTIIICTFIFLIFSKYRIKIESINENKLLSILLLYDFFLCLLWLVLANTHEGADQAQVLYAAKDFANGDFTKLMPDKYMGMFPYQLPLALIYEPFYLIFGELTPFLWQFINLFLICGIQYLIYKISTLTLFDTIHKNWVIIALFFDLPIILYVSFVYGTIIGLFFSLLSIYYFLVYSSTKKVKYIIISVISIVAACLLRNNNLIFLIALCIIAFLNIIETKNYKLFLIYLCIPLFFVSKQSVISLYEVRSGIIISKGEPMTLNIAMGLSDNSERAAGWFNGYTWDTYLDFNCDYEQSNDFAKEKISESLDSFVYNPIYACSFFSRKIDSMWLNPDFQGLWNNEHHGQYIAYVPIINSLYKGKLHLLSGFFLNIIVFSTYLGICLYLILNWKKIQWKNCVLILCFIGGFLFHLFWEAKAQYVIVYYSLIFPYAGIGYHDLIYKITIE